MTKKIYVIFVSKNLDILTFEKFLQMRLIKQKVLTVFTALTVTFFRSIIHTLSIYNFLFLITLHPLLNRSPRP